MVDKSSDKNSVQVCSCNLENGYIFKNFFQFNNIKGQPVITITKTKITAKNNTFDNRIYSESFLYGDEINLIWADDIPMDQRSLTLTYDASKSQATIGKIKKKDQARIYICQNRTNQYTQDFTGPHSSNDFTVYISCGPAGEKREGIQCIPAHRVTPPTVNVIKPAPKIFPLIVPIGIFKQMIDSYTKCKKLNIKLIYFDNTKCIDGLIQKNDHGILITTNNLSVCDNIIEKYGEIPDDDTKIYNMSSKLDDSIVVRPANRANIIIDEPVDKNPNEYIFEADKIGHFSKLSVMHHEGNVRIYYQQGADLYLGFRFGCFGECGLYITNKPIKT